MAKVIITDAKQKNKKEQYCVFDYGSFFVDSSDHIHTTRWVSNEQVPVIISQIKSNQNTKDCEIKVVNRAYPVVQLKGPMSIRDDLPKAFVKGHFSEQIRMRKAIPGSFAEVDDTILDALKEKKSLEEILKDARCNIDSSFSSNAPSYRTRVFNVLCDAFEKKDMGILEQYQFAKKIPSAVLAKVTGAIPRLENLQKVVSLEIDKKDITIDITSNCSEAVKNVEAFSFDEVMARKFLFMDIEIPYFKAQNPKDRDVRWVGMNYYENGKMTKEMHTLSDLGTDEFKEYKLFTYKTEEELIEGVRKSVLKENPYYVSTYNTKFDLLKLRERGVGFKIGEDESKPLMEVNTKFFERIGLLGREVIDLLRWSQIMFDFLPNQKLETVAKYVLGEMRFSKSISYDEMKELEDIARSDQDIGRRREAARKIASYLSDDVDILPELFLSRQFTESLRVACVISKKYGIPLTHLLYSANAVNEAQDKSFFQNVGTYRDERVGKNIQMIEERSKARQAFKKRTALEVLADTRPGIYDNIYKIYARHGKMLRHLIAKRFPDGKFILDMTSDEPSVRHFIARYQNALLRYIVEDYEIYSNKVSEFRRFCDECKVQESEIVALYDKLTIKYSNLRRTNPPKRDVLRELTSYHFKKFISHEIDANMSYLGSKVCDLLNMYTLVRKQERVIGGNYALQIHDIEIGIIKAAESVQDFAFKNGLKVVHANGHYVYLQGGDEAIYQGAHLEKIPRALLAKDSESKNSIYYEVRGTLFGDKIKDHPDNRHNMFEMQSLGEYYRLILIGKKDEAVLFLKQQSKRIERKNEISNDDLVWYNKSRECFRAYEKGKEILFYLPSQLLSEEQLASVQSEGSRQFLPINTSNGKISKGKTQEEGRIYIMNVCEFEPDLAMYSQRQQKFLQKFYVNTFGSGNDAVQTSLFD